MNKKEKAFSVFLFAALLSLTFPASHAASLSYSDFRANVGDGTRTVCSSQVNTSDILKTSDSLIANVHKKPAQAHADSFFKVNASVTEVYYSISFVLPHAQKADLRQTYDTQAIEADVSVYVGQSHTKYTAAIQWIVNPWTPLLLGFWREGGWADYEIDGKIAPNQTYTFVVYMNVKQGSGWAEIKGQGDFAAPIAMNHFTFSSEAQPTWGAQDSLYVTAENISATPSCSSPPVGFISDVHWSNPVLKFSLK